MRNLTLSVALILIGLFVISSCSSSQQSSNLPTSPDMRESGGNEEMLDGHSLMGIYTVDIDAQNGTVEVMRNRDGEKHWDVTLFLLPPNCPNCFSFSVLNVDPPAKNIDVRVTLKNPTNLTGYDVRGIITDFGGLVLLNPDSYTKLFGLGSINPFIAWIPNADRTFPALQLNSEDITIHNPNFPIFPQFEFVIEASWPSHCKEPYEINPLPVTQDLKSDGSNTVKVIAIVQDWQDNVESVTIDLSPLGGLSSVQMISGMPTLYEKQISYVSGPGEGYYDLLITATTSDPVLNKTLYNYTTVHVVGPGTEFPVEFGSEERISFTSGQSFIWPRHAIATDSQGNPHVVWADNDPDPMNPVYKLYYAKRSSGGDWQTPQIIGATDSDIVYPTLCIDGNNTIHIIWEDQRAGQLSSDIYYSNSTNGFLNEVKLTDAQPMVRHAFPRCVAAGGFIHLTWHDNRNDITGANYDVFYTTYDPSNGQMGEELIVEADAGTWEGFPTIDADTSGAIHVAYQKFEGTMKIYHREKSGPSFGSAHLVTDNTAYQPAVSCGNSSQDVFISWFDYSDGTFSDVYLGISTDSGVNFDTTKISTSSTEYQINPDVLQAGNGDIYMVWAEEGYVDIDGEPGPDDLNDDDIIDQNDALPHRVYFRQRMGLTWLDEQVLTEDTEIAAFPQIAVGQDEFVHVPYMKWTIDDPYDNYELYYRRSLPF